jgi:hypothetical protein
VDTKILKDMITVIRTEQERRTSLLQNEDPNFAYDQWLLTDGPFLNELCLMFLVTLRHQIEREMVGLAARSDEKQMQISDREYQENINQLRRTNKKGQNIGWDWKEIYKRLKLETCKNYEFIEALRLLSNLYKHEPSLAPDEDLLNLLHLEIGVNYASLPESDALREGFAKFLGLSDDADYCDIAERFVDISNTFITTVKSMTKLSKVKWGAISLNPDDFAR